MEHVDVYFNGGGGSLNGSCVGWLGVLMLMLLTGVGASRKVSWPTNALLLLLVDNDMVTASFTVKPACSSAVGQTRTLLTTTIIP